ncbi:MAG: zinc-dependent metalloprotease [Planctomycetaceae bacterium]
MSVRRKTLMLSLAMAFGVVAGNASADEPNSSPKPEAKSDKPATVAAGEAPASGGGAPMGSAAPAPPPYANLLKDMKPVNGLLTMYNKGNGLVAELGPGDYNAEYMVLISISRGIARDQLLGGMSLYFGDDWVWQFRKVDDNVHIVRRNVRFKANAGSPEAMAVQHSYTDSVLFSLPIMMKGPKGGDLVDLTPVFMSDLPQISSMLPGFGFSPQKSSWASIKGFDSNMELEVAATYASSGAADIETVPDSRGVGINLHYSISKIPAPGSYQPRLADDRVGYFLTAVKDFSSKSDREQFVRYINRWDLQKADGQAKVSPPVKPIKFYIEKAVPRKYEKAIYDGIYEWNKAFEAAGFVNAIIVERQADKDSWDPEDINYNTFRWITSNAGFAMGPSRVNPYTGQILDADIIFDADFLTYWKEDFENLTPQAIADMTGGPLDFEGQKDRVGPRGIFSMKPVANECLLSRGLTSQFAFGAAAIQAAAADPKIAAENLDKFIMQGLKEVTMHEVGHTLGLRHNFKASKWMSLADMNNPEKAKGGTTASVMDYTPPNIALKGQPQGDYYTQTVGPYDVWAITYGYTPLQGGTQGEVENLKKIANRSGEPALLYATDEDTSGTDPDPDSNRFDNGADPIEFAKHRVQQFNELLPGLVERVTNEGDDYTQARRVFNILLSQKHQSLFFASRYVGGLKTSRNHRGDKDAKPPVSLVDVKQQRDILALLDEQVFSDKPYQFPPELYNQLGWSNWNHWGVDRMGPRRKDVGVHDLIEQWQMRILSQLVSPVTLERMHDSELKAPADVDVMTVAELLEHLTKSIYSEVETVKEGEFTTRKPAISSIRRNLQRNYMRRIADIALGNTSAPQDCQTIAFDQLDTLNGRIQALLNNQGVKLDAYSRSHLKETSSRIQKVLDARLTLFGP